MEPFTVIMGLNFVKSVVDGFQQNKRSLMQQAENEAARDAQRKNILIQLQEQRKRDAILFENELKKQEYLVAIRDVWPLRIPPREYCELFRPNKIDGKVAFNLIIDNRIQTRMGCLCESLWSELEQCLRECFGGIRPYQFNSDIFTKCARGAGVEISFLHKYSEHIPTLVLVPDFKEEELILTAYAWGAGMGYQTGSIVIQITQLRLDVARKITNDYKEMFCRAKKSGMKDMTFNPTLAQYDTVFQKEADALKNGMTKEECYALGIYDRITKTPELNEIGNVEKELYKELSKTLARQILLPIGQIIDTYFVESYGLSPCLPELMSKIELSYDDKFKILSECCKKILDGIKTSTSVLSNNQITDFINSLTESGFQDCCNDLKSFLEESSIIPQRMIPKEKSSTDDTPISKIQCRNALKSGHVSQLETSDYAVAHTVVTDSKITREKIVSAYTGCNLYHFHFVSDNMSPKAKAMEYALRSILKIPKEEELFAFWDDRTWLWEVSLSSLKYGFALGVSGIWLKGRVNKEAVFYPWGKIEWIKVKNDEGGVIVIKHGENNFFGAEKFKFAPLYERKCCEALQQAFNAIGLQPTD